MMGPGGLGLEGDPLLGMKVRIGLCAGDRTIYLPGGLPEGSALSGAPAVSEHFRV